ncbi:MAG TPA: hypothetical protein VLJ83_07535 [Gemmatimonadaceae bacterium]|nr:hypothetical protein [Gemmatimonadaceae bacterium]
MPRQKDFKRLVRARMKKTGEAYTTARARLEKKPKPKPDYARLAGLNDAKLKEQTGCTWERWVRALDQLGAEKMSHREIAELVKRKYKVADWWTQTVTVGYERIKGLRARGQQRDGSYETSKSRTFGVPVKTLFDAWSDADTRKRWLSGEKVRIRTATAPRSMRLDWTDGSIIAIGFAAKGRDKSSVAVQHTGLRDRESADRIRKYWSERLDMLKDVLESPTD